MKFLMTTAMGAAVAILLASCGGGSPSNLGTTSTSTVRGTLIQNPPPRLTNLTAASFTSLLNGSPAGQSLLQLTGAPVCGVDVQYVTYATVGGAGETTTATAALMTPNNINGSNATAAQCSGARPIVLYAHGTNITKSFNLAALADSTNAANGEASLLAAMWVAQGYTVVAPNYAGYDASPLPYHPYLNADQQSKDMIDALSASRAALPGLMNPIADNHKLFILGYSQGGHVAMATQRAIEAAGGTVTASVPMSGPYALASLSDAVYYGNVNAGSTIFTPLLTTSWQKAYGNIYTTPSDIYETPYATGIETLLPGAYDFTTVVTSGKLPQLALFNSVAPTAPTGPTSTLQLTLNQITAPFSTGNPTDALFNAGFGTGNLIKNSARLSYLLDAFANPDGVVPTVTNGLPAAAPASPFRIAAKLNDLRTVPWQPHSPMMLCGGNADPTVFFSVNTSVMQAYWSSPSPLALPTGQLTVLDVDSAPTGPSDPFAAVKAGFAANKAAVAAAAGGGAAGAVAVTGVYHGTLVPPFCQVAARGFISHF